MVDLYTIMLRNFQRGYFYREIVDDRPYIDVNISGAKSAFPTNSLYVDDSLFTPNSEAWKREPKVPRRPLRERKRSAPDRYGKRQIEAKWELKRISNLLEDANREYDIQEKREQRLLDCLNRYEGLLRRAERRDGLPPFSIDFYDMDHQYLHACLNGVVKKREAAWAEIQRLKGEKEAI